MSFHVIEQCTARLNRSELAVPGSNTTFLEKAAHSPADVIFLDLEDAVAPDDKEKARKNIIEALNDLDWGGRTLSIRINGLDTHYMYRDVVDILEQAVDKLDLIMIPKAGTAADIYAVDMLVTQIEAAKGYKKRIGFEMIIETALGMQNVDEIAAASPRNECLGQRGEHGSATLVHAEIRGGREPVSFVNSAVPLGFLRGSKSNELKLFEHLTNSPRSVRTMISGQRTGSKLPVPRACSSRPPARVDPCYTPRFDANPGLFPANCSVTYQWTGFPSRDRRADQGSVTESSGSGDWRLAGVRGSCRATTVITRERRGSPGRSPALFVGDGTTASVTYTAACGWRGSRGRSPSLLVGDGTTPSVICTAATSRRARARPIRSFQR